MLILSIVQLYEVQTDNRLHPMQDCMKEKKDSPVLDTKLMLPMGLM